MNCDYTKILQFEQPFFNIKYIFNGFDWLSFAIHFIGLDVLQLKNKPQNNPQKKATKIVLVDAFTFSTYSNPIKYQDLNLSNIIF